MLEKSSCRVASGQCRLLIESKAGGAAGDRGPGKEGKQKPKAVVEYRGHSRELMPVSE